MSKFIKESLRFQEKFLSSLSYSNSPFLFISIVRNPCFILSTLFSNGTEKNYKGRIMNMITVDRLWNSTRANRDLHNDYSFVFPVLCLQFSLQVILFPWLLFTYKFVTHEDICEAFNGDTLLAIVAPSGTQLEVPLPETVVWVTDTNITLFNLCCTNDNKFVYRYLFQHFGLLRQVISWGL